MTTARVRPINSLPLAGQLDGSEVLIGSQQGAAVAITAQKLAAKAAGLVSAQTPATKASVGLGNVDNLSASQLAAPSNPVGFALAAAAAHAASQENPHGVTKSQVGLGSVDNLSAAQLVQPGNAVGNRFAKRKVLSDYGPAVGNGDNATAAWSAAMADVLSSTVDIPDGTFLIDPVALSAPSSVSFDGAGMGRTIIKISTPGATLTDALFKWINRPNVRISNLTVDLNGCFASPAAIQVPVFLMFGADRCIVENVEIKNAAGPYWFPIQFNGGIGGRISGCRVSLNAPNTKPNQGISLTNTFSALSGVVVENNTLINTGFAATISGRIIVTGNNISGWYYGGGITLAESAVFTYPLVYGNTIHDSGFGADENNTIPNGIESHAPGAMIFGNDIRNVGSGGIAIAGKGTTGGGNTCTGWGKGGVPSGSTAIQLLYYSPTHNASGTRLTGDRLIDDGTGTDKYAFRDQAGITDAFIAGAIVSASISTYSFAGATKVVTAASGANSDITSLSGLTTPLSAPQGGTGYSGGAWQSFQPSFSAVDGSGVTFGGAAFYLLIGKLLHIRISLVINYTGTAPTKFTFNLPTGMSWKDISAGSASNHSAGLVLGASSIGNGTVTVFPSTSQLVTGSGQFLGVNMVGDIA